MEEEPSIDKRVFLLDPGVLRTISQRAMAVLSAEAVAEGGGREKDVILVLEGGAAAEAEVATVAAAAVAEEMGVLAIIEGSGFGFGFGVWFVFDMKLSSLRAAV